MIDHAPRSSIILTSYNRPRLVADAIKSVLAQTDPSWELLVMDDDSNDETRASIIAAAGGDPRVRLFWSPPVDPSLRQAQLRYSVRINDAVPEVRGDFVTYECDDDYLYPRSLEARITPLISDPDLHVSYGRLRSISFDTNGPNGWDTLGKPEPGMTFPAFGEMDPAIGKITNDASWSPGLWGPPIGGTLDHNQVMHRRACFDEMGGPPWWPEGREHNVGDAAFFKRLDALGHKAMAVDEFVVTKRYHGRNDGKAGTSPVRE